MCFAPQRRALFRHFFDIWTSKSGPRPSVFNTFDLEMCFAPQRRALFRHCNFQKWSENGVFCTFWLGNVLRATPACTFSTSQLPKVVRRMSVFCTFWLGNVLRATTACTFSTSQLPKVVRRWGVLYILTWKCASRHNGVHFFDISTSKSGPNAWGVLYILTWKCASRHNGVQFFIAPVASWLRTRRFSEPTFRPSWATNHWKNAVFRDFPTFSRICIFCPLTLSLLIFSLLIFLFSVPLPCSAFHLSILSEVWLLNFLRTLTHLSTNPVVTTLPHQPPHQNVTRPGRHLVVRGPAAADQLLHFLRRCAGDLQHPTWRMPVEISSDYPLYSMCI